MQLSVLHGSSEQKARGRFIIVVLLEALVCCFLSPGVTTRARSAGARDPATVWRVRTRSCCSEVSASKSVLTVRQTLIPCPIM